MEGLSQFIRNLGAGRLLIVGLVGVLTFGLFAVLIGRVQQAPMGILYSDLDPADASTIVSRLDAQNVPYQLEAGGRIISVPSDQIDRLRLSLAGEGLSGNVVGKEIFDREGSFGRTSFELNVNFVRAVEGELARTIKYIQSVSEARVHIVMPERRPFQREASEPSASILVKTMGGGLGQRQAQAIQSLVASAIPGLSPDRVTISDTAGRLLTDGADDSIVGGFSDLEEARMMKERMYREKIESLIGQRVGREKVRAEVSVQMSMERTTTSQIEYDPDGQVVLSSDVTEESSTESSSDGQVSVANNVPGQDNAAQGAGGSANENNKTQETTNFENSRTERVTVSEPGRIEQIRVSVIVDGIRTTDGDGNETYTERSAEEISSFQSLVESAIPYNTDRGDMVTVESMRFADPPVFEEIEESAILGLGTNQLLRLAETLGLVVLGLLMILLVVRPLVGRIIEAIPDAPPPADPNQIDSHVGADAPAIAAPGAAGAATAELAALAAQGDEGAAAALKAAKASGDLDHGAMHISSQIDVAQVEGRIQDSALKRVSEIINSNPDDSAAIVRQWMYAD